MTHKIEIHCLYNKITFKSDPMLRTGIPKDFIEKYKNVLLSIREKTIYLNCNFTIVAEWEKGEMFLIEIILLNNDLNIVCSGETIDAKYLKHNIDLSNIFKFR